MRKPAASLSTISIVHDPDLPNQAPPFARPESLVREGEVIVSIDGEDLLGVTDERALLRGKAGTQVLLRVKSTAGAVREVLVVPMKEQDEARLRYAEWEYSRRSWWTPPLTTQSAMFTCRPWALTISINGRANSIQSSIARG